VEPNTDKAIPITHVHFNATWIFFI
jgi:hypothetical protein